jgi:hypothetical protein
MENTRRNFVLSLAMSLITVWLYFGFYPFSHTIFPMTEGAALNTLMQMAAIPLMLAIVVGGGLATASAITSAIESEATRKAERRKLALLAPPAVVWILFMAAMALPLGPVANVIVVCVSALAIMRILQNVASLGVFRSSRTAALGVRKPELVVIGRVSARSPSA